MKIEDVLKKYVFGWAEAAQILDAALQCSTVMGKDFTIDLLGLAGEGGMGKLPEEMEAQDRISKVVCRYPWTWDNVATLAEKVAPLTEVFTFEGLLARISPLVRGLDVEPMTCDTRRPCLVNNRKHWFLRWQDRKWVTEAIVEDQETGQVAEVYPREVRFLDSVRDQDGENA